MKEVASESGEKHPRRAFLARAGAVGVTLLGTSLSNAFADTVAPSASNDQDILNAAKIAEALAVTMYTNLINTAPFFTRLPSDDQGYFQAAVNEEMSHYLLLQSATGNLPSPYTTFYFPMNMFSSAQVSLNTLVTLEDAFVAAYLVGVREFSTSDLRLTAARIMGIESDHRTLGRDVAGDVAAQDGGPIASITGLAGVAESADPPNNNGYERTYGLTSIADAVTALMPFFSESAATTAGFDTTKPYTFVPFTPTLPSTLGALTPS